MSWQKYLRSVMQSDTNELTPLDEPLVNRSRKEFEYFTKLSKTLVGKYAKDLTEADIFMIIQKAYVLGISPFDALNGGIVVVKGNYELSYHLMARLIRQKGHSITKDSSSSDEICILHGRRADNGDTWTESFSLVDAKRAGLLSNASWQKYPRNMLFARALSNLAKFLFSDVIAGCYVTDEVPRKENPLRVQAPQKSEKAEIEQSEYELVEDCPLSGGQVGLLKEAVADNPAMKSRIDEMFGKDWSQIDPEDYAKLIEELA